MAPLTPFDKRPVLTMKVRREPPNFVTSQKIRPRELVLEWTAAALRRVRDPLRGQKSLGAGSRASNPLRLEISNARRRFVRRLIELRAAGVRRSRSWLPRRLAGVGVETCASACGSAAGPRSSDRNSHGSLIALLCDRCERELFDAGPDQSAAESNARGRFLRGRWGVAGDD